MGFKYVVHYKYGQIGSYIGCNNLNQAKEMAWAIVLYAKTVTDDRVEISIENAVNGKTEPFMY